MQSYGSSKLHVVLLPNLVSIEQYMTKLCYGQAIREMDKDIYSQVILFHWKANNKISYLSNHKKNNTCLQRHCADDKLIH